jgi:hypothetical protein
MQLPGLIFPLSADLRASSPPNKPPCLLKIVYWSIAAEAFEDELASFLKANVTACLYYVFLASL